MLTIIRRVQPKTETTDVTLYAGDTVRDDAGRVGKLVRVGISPYYAEERARIFRAYVEFADSADWFKAGELTLVSRGAL